MNPYKFITLLLFIFSLQQSLSQSIVSCDSLTFESDRQKIDTSRYFLLTTAIADTTSLIVIGTVIDQYTGKPIKNAEVLLGIKDGNLEDKSMCDAKGNFKVSLFDGNDDKQYLKITSPEYKCLLIDNFEFKGANFFEIIIKLNPN